MPESFEVEVAYATPERQLSLKVSVPEGTNLQEAIELSGILSEFEGLEIDPGRVGVFGRKAKLQQVLKPGDRVEIYRPLLIDPKEARRAKAIKDSEGE